MKEESIILKEELTAEEREAGWREVPGLEADGWDMPQSSVASCPFCEHRLCNKCRKLVIKTRLYEGQKRSQIMSDFSENISSCGKDCKVTSYRGMLDLPKDGVRCCQCASPSTLGSWLLGIVSSNDGLFPVWDHDSMCKKHPLSTSQRRSLIIENNLDRKNGRITNDEYSEALPKKFKGKWYSPEEFAALGEEEMAKLAK